MCVFRPLIFLLQQQEQQQQKKRHKEIVHENEWSKWRLTCEMGNATLPTEANGDKKKTLRVCLFVFFFNKMKRQSQICVWWQQIWKNNQRERERGEWKESSEGQPVLTLNKSNRTETQKNVFDLKKNDKKKWKWNNKVLKRNRKYDLIRCQSMSFALYNHFCLLARLFLWVFVL